MSLDWSTFKSKLNLDRVSVSYVDEEGTEISVDSESEFQEALRLAKLNKNHLQLILTVDESSDFTKLNNTHKIDNVVPEISVLANKKKKLKYNSSDLTAKENSYHCKSGTPPEWFTHYMRKFKKELLHELKACVNERVHSALRKEGKILETNSKINELPHDVKAVSKEKKKMKSDDYLEQVLLDQRELKALKKSLGLRPTKLERLESKLDKLEIKMKNGGKLDFPEKEIKEKALEKVLDSVNEKRQTFKKSCVISSLGTVKARPGSSFSLHIFVENTGDIPVSSPQLILCASDEFLTDVPKKKNLRKLQPHKKCFVEVELKAKETTGSFKVMCTAVDGDEILGEPVDVWVEITPEPINSSVASDSKETKNEDNELIDFNHDVIAKSQKKIKENIFEIEKRLQHIDLLRSSTIFEDEKFENKENKTKENKCESLKDINNEVFFKAGEVGTFFNHSLEQQQTDFDFANSQDTYVISKKDNLSESLKNREDRCDSEKNSDSEISVVYGSDENFIVVLSGDEEDWTFAKKEESVSGTEDINKNNENTATKTSLIDEDDDLIQLKSCEVEMSSEKSTANENVRNQFSSNSSCCYSSRSRRSPFGDDSSEFKSKKMKSKGSFEYQFANENLTQSMFSKERKEKEKNSTFKFTAESVDEKEKSYERIQIPTVDSVGRVIYAVDLRGYCVPIKTLLRKKGNSSFEDSRRKNGAGDRGNGSASTQNDSIKCYTLLNIIKHVASALKK